MSAGWKRKRFWKDATHAPANGGYEILLDGRRVKTPAKAPLLVPTEALASAIVKEWQAQGEDVDPATMPCTRSANAAIDKVAVQHREVAGMIADYGDTDLLCYRATAPKELRARQDAAWDPLLEWAARELGAGLEVREGIVHAPQDTRALLTLRRLVEAMDPFRLTALHDLVGLSGSLIIGLAATRHLMPSEELWALSRIDEKWQEEQWGADDLARRESAARARDFLHAARFFGLL